MGKRRTNSTPPPFRTEMLTRVPAQGPPWGGWASPPTPRGQPRPSLDTGYFRCSGETYCQLAEQRQPPVPLRMQTYLVYRGRASVVILFQCYTMSTWFKNRVQQHIVVLQQQSRALVASAASTVVLAAAEYSSTASPELVVWQNCNVIFFQYCSSFSGSLQGIHRECQGGTVEAGEGDMHGTTPCLWDKGWGPAKVGCTLHPPPPHPHGTPL